MSGQHKDKTTCPHGHGYTTENTLLRTDKRGHTRRFCRTCQQVRNLEIVEMRKAVGYGRANPDAVRAAFAALARATQAVEDEGLLIPCVADGVDVWESRHHTEQVRMCVKCPVKDACLTLGTLDQHSVGVWGGKLMNLARGSVKPWAHNPNPKGSVNGVPQDS